MVLTTEQLRVRIETAPLSAIGRYYRHAFRAMGTDCHIDFAATSPAQAGRFKQFVAGWLASFEATYSRFLPDSLVSRINAAAGKDWVAIDADAASLFALCDWFHWSTHGIFDPATLPLLRAWDYHTPHAEPPGAEQVRTALALCGWSKLERRPDSVRLQNAGMGIDLGGIGKEYAVDRVFEMARDLGMANIMVNFGNDVRVAGEPPEGGLWRVGLEDPANPGQCWNGAALTDRAVTTSGDYLRNFQHGDHRYGHIIDPRTGYPVNNNCRAVSVIGATCTEAGVLSTTAFILGPEEGIRFISGFVQNEGCIIASDRRYTTRRFDEYLIER